ncbi:pitrilysin family protein [Haloechinothrix sp. LS1_15]|uniref:M16 family metallopeptidase n=1 Tax=Haloechinothrix sp. LS1_15 TaxID=2652248 RepID=UPI0029468BFF|nr:pitrilysin family protein [Haloechinothrix sp. LS1_15]MDV6012148.1 insulinase family protein [Haloechinothrix sp. LS1_15]
MTPRPPADPLSYQLHHGAVTPEPAGDRAVVERSVLRCGLRVVTERMPGMRSAAVGVWVGTGSRDEPVARAGAAHYLEHMLFKGTGRRDATGIAEEIDTVGGELNAFTAKEHTCYYAHVRDHDLPLAVDLLTDLVFDAACRDADVDTERGVILDEIAMRDDDPEDLLHEMFLRSMLGDHPVGRSVLGTHDSVAGMSAAALRVFYRDHYRPPNMVLAAAGNIDHERLLGLVREALDDRFPDAEPVGPRQGSRDTNDYGCGDGLVLTGDDIEQAHLMLGAPGLDRHDERRYALGVLNAALGGGTSSRLFQEVRERRGLAYQVYSSIASYADTGHVAVYAGCQPGRLGETTAVISEVLAGVAEHGLDAAELDRAKGQLRGGLVLGLEDTAARMTRLGKNELNYGRHIDVEEALTRIDAVGVGEVAELAGWVVPRPGAARAAAVVGPYAHIDELPDELREVMG